MGEDSLNGYARGVYQAMPRPQLMRYLNGSGPLQKMSSLESVYRMRRPQLVRYPDG